MDRFNLKTISKDKNFSKDRLMRIASSLGIPKKKYLSKLQIASAINIFLDSNLSIFIYDLNQVCPDETKILDLKSFEHLQWEKIRYLPEYTLEALQYLIKKYNIPTTKKSRSLLFEAIKSYCINTKYNDLYYDLQYFSFDDLEETRVFYHITPKSDQKLSLYKILYVNNSIKPLEKNIPQTFDMFNNFILNQDFIPNAQFIKWILEYNIQTKKDLSNIYYFSKKTLCDIIILGFYKVQTPFKLPKLEKYEYFFKNNFYKEPEIKKTYSFYEKYAEYEEPTSNKKSFYKEPEIKKTYSFYEKYAEYEEPTSNKKSFYKKPNSNKNSFYKEPEIKKKNFFSPYKHFFDILNIPTTSTLTEVKRAYKQLALKHHPDKNQNSKESSERFKKIKDAYDTILKIYTDFI